MYYYYVKIHDAFSIQHWTSSARITWHGYPSTRTTHPPLFLIQEYRSWLTTLWSRFKIPQEEALICVVRNSKIWNICARWQLQFSALWMPITQQDLLEWTQEYRTLRDINPSLPNFNDWIKERIISIEKFPQQHQQPNNQSHGLNGNHHAPLPTHPLPTHAYEHMNTPTRRSTPASARSVRITTAQSPASTRRSPRTQASPQSIYKSTSPYSTPKTILKGIPAQPITPQRSRTNSSPPPRHSHYHSPPHHFPPPAPSAPSPPLITPEQQLHLQPHALPSTPVLHPVPSPLRSPTPPSSDSSTPPLSSHKPSPPYFPPSYSTPLATLVPQPLQSPKKETKTKSMKKRYMSPPPRTALFRSLSQSLIFPSGSPAQQMTRVATYEYPLDMQVPPSDVAELKNYLTQFQSKQQNQLFQIFDVVEQINTKLSRDSLPPPHLHSQPSPPPRRPSPKKATKGKSAARLLAKKDPSPFAAIFTDQVI